MNDDHLPFLNKRKSNIQLIDELGQHNRNSMPNLISDINQAYLDKFKRKEQFNPFIDRMDNLNLSNLYHLNIQMPSINH